MQEEILSWLAARNKAREEKPLPLKSNWDTPETKDASQTIFFVETKEGVIGEFVSLDLACQLQADTQGSWLRPWTPPEQEDERLVRRDQWRWQHSGGTAPFVREEGGGLSVFSASRKCGTHKQTLIAVSRAEGSLNYREAERKFERRRVV